MDFNCCHLSMLLIRRGYEEAVKVPHGNPEIITGGVKIAEKVLRSLMQQQRIQHQNNSPPGEKNKVVVLIGEVRTLKARFKHLLHRGHGLVQQDTRRNRVRWEDVKSAFNSRIRTGLVINLEHLDIVAFMADAFALFSTRVRNAIKSHSAVKVNAVLVCAYKVIQNGEEVIESKYFNTKNAAILQSTNVREWYNVNIAQPITAQMEEFEGNASGWSLHEVTHIMFNINKFNPMRGSSYIELPNSIKDKKACVNVENVDDKCFMWAVLSALYPIDRLNNPYRVVKYMHLQDKLNFSGINFPVQLHAIPRFEKQNDISINVYVLQKRGKNFHTAPAHLTGDKRDRHVNLLLVEESYEDNENNEYTSEECESGGFIQVKRHYVWVKNLSRLVCNQLAKTQHKKFICDRCLQYFRCNEKLIQHTRDCGEINGCKVILPSKRGNNHLLKFKNHKNKERSPFIIYADFECLLKRVEQPENPKNTEIQQLHEAFSIGYYIKCSFNDSQSSYNSYRGPKPAVWFTRELLRWSRELEGAYGNPAPMQLTPEEEASFQDAVTCHICEKVCAVKVRDHCHLTGRYRGVAHKKCNINYQDSRVIPVIFHNLSGYDSHIIIREIATGFEGSIDILPLNNERYISFTKHVKNSLIKFRFLDSFRFLTTSLDKLASYLDSFKIVRKEFNYLSDDKFKLITRKGIFPYEYVDNLTKLDVLTLPDQDDFYSHLTDSSVSDVEYEHAQSVWREFNIRNLGEYSDLYLKTDVLLLADVFEAFRDSCLGTYKLDPAHYYTTPGLTWDAMLNYTEVELELLTDIDMLMFIERGIRGGISQCSNRYAHANNKYMGERYNASEKSKYLMYYDVNNLYGWAMTQYLPYGGFTWVPNATNYNVAEDSPFGYILEVDLEYPQILHDTHKDLPLCPEHRKPPGSKEFKLLTTLYGKKRYIIHYRNLMQAVSNGLTITKIHRILRFKQSPWLKSYIDLNSNMRRAAKNDFEKNLYKLMNNAVFGKTMENVRKHADIRLVTKWGGRYGAGALIAKPNFARRTIFSENLVSIEMNKLEVVMNKPIYVGFCVLDLSKICVYNFHYGYMLPTFKSDCKLLYTDTDSLIYQITCEDIYCNIKRDIARFDTSDYPKNNIYGVPLANKKIVGLMKDECNGGIMTEFVGLRSKMYSVRVNGEDRMKKAKGVNTSVVKKTIVFNDYVECLNDSVVKYRNQYSIRSHLHQLQTIKQNKVALSPHDDKRYLLLDTTDTLPWGHYTINDENNVNCEVMLVD